MLRLFYRLMVRPLFREPVRSALTVLAVALGVAVVLAIDLAGNAAAGSFRSSMETLSGDNNLEITASGGIPENIVGTLASLPYALRISPRVESFAVLTESKQTLPLIGIDLVSESSSRFGQVQQKGAAAGTNGFACASLRTDDDSSSAEEQWAEERSAESALDCIVDPSGIWVGASLGRKPGERLTLLINDQVHDYLVSGVYPDSNGNESAIVMDIAAAQRALTRFGRIDRILIKTPPTPELSEWQQRLREALPAGIEVRLQGTIGPDLKGAGARWNGGQLRLRVVDAPKLNPETIMPPYYRVDGLTRVATSFRGKPVLSADQIEDVVAYLATLGD